MGFSTSTAGNERSLTEQRSREQSLRDSLLSVVPVASGCSLTQKLLLLILLCINFSLFFGRGTFAGSLMAIRVDPALQISGKPLSDSQSGLLVSGFMVGYMLSCPVFAALQVRLGFRRVLLTSLTGWALTCVGTAFAWGYGALVGWRVLAGVGEAAFISFAMTTMDNVAPAATRTTWIGAFYAMVPLGSAAGIGVGGVVSGGSPIAGVSPWRAVFLVEGMLAVPMLLLFTLIPSKYYTLSQPRRQREREREGELPEAISLATAVVGLLRDPNYVLLVAGFSACSFVGAGLSVWGLPTLVQGPLGMAGGEAAALLGGTTAICGVSGALLGGVAVDRLGGSHGCGVVNCLRFNQGMLVVAIVCGLLALMQSRIGWFLGFFVLAMISIFSVIAPANACILTVVKPAVRPYAVGVLVFFTHLLGDFPSPIFVGLISDKLGRQCMSYTTEETCHAKQGERCRWRPISYLEGAWQCWYELQLRNALLITYLMLLVTLLCWNWVYRRVYTKIGLAIRIPPGDVSPISGTEAEQEGERLSRPTLSISK